MDLPALKYAELYSEPKNNYYFYVNMILID